MAIAAVTEGTPPSDGIDEQLLAIRVDFVARLWRSLFWVVLIGAPLSVSRASFTGWLPVYSVHLALMGTAIVIYWQRHRLSYRQLVNSYLVFMWAVGLPGVFTFGLAASSIWWLVLSCYVASKAYSVAVGFVLAAAAGAVLSLAGSGFVSGWLTLKMDANAYFTEPGAWVTLLVVTGAFVLTVLYSTAGYHRSLVNLMQQVRRQHDHIQQLATHDALTGLPVLRLTTDRMQMAFARARRSGRKVALLFIDLDRFKRINDRHGHEAGDVVLQETAQRLQALLRAEDTVSRIGGDEFVVALTDLPDAATASAVAAKIVEAVSQPVAHANESLRVGVSIGISLFPDHAEDYPSLRRLADQAMYDVKRGGRNGYALAGASPAAPHRQARRSRRRAA